ncbi:hypothetical protein [Streptomyces xiaopingdaonensis]|uniref:hypothetical protein n=1 Tax=Streptomyces xiaopingdaonensis TaxID=1565415 RepID=UPI000309C833|nr:hypothetical protein [Streptomyces xiaopingdaonensis]
MRIVLPVFGGFTALDVVGPYEVLRTLRDAGVLLVSYERGEVSDGTRRPAARRASRLR